ncbi:hypothetical protein [Hydrogenimonas sp.]
MERFVDELTRRCDLVYSRIAGSGVAKNRNNCLQYIEPGSISFICDDDVSFCEGAQEKILEAFSKIPDADVVTFKIGNETTNADLKPYPKRAMKHTLRSLSGIGATEVAFRSDVIFDSGVLFDTCFGPGTSDYPTGEDYIFVTDLYRLGYRLYFEPVTVVSHPPKSTGTTWSEKIVFGKGAVWARVYGYKGVLIALLFALKKYGVYRKEISFFRFLSSIQRGSLDYLFRGRKKCKELLKFR